MKKTTINHPYGSFTFMYDQDQIEWNRFKRNYSVELLSYDPNTENGHHYHINFTEKFSGKIDSYSWYDEDMSDPEPYYGHFNRHSCSDDDFSEYIKYLTYTKIKDFKKPITTDKLPIEERVKLENFIKTI